MVRDPSIVSPSLTGVFIGGGHNKHGTGSRYTLPKQCGPPSPRRRWRCDRSSYKRSLFSRIRDSQMHYLTGPETITRQHPVTVSDLCGVRYILARHTRRSHTDCNPEARAYAHLAGPRHDGGTDWHAHVPQWWPMVLCTLPPHVGKPLPTYVGPAFPGASSCLKHPTDRQACLVFLYSTLSFPL